MYLPTHEAAAAHIEADGTALHFLGAHAKGAIKGLLLEMQLEQRFRNPSQCNVEVTYTCPLPWGAVLLGVDVVLNGQSLQGTVVEKTQARETYEDALQEGNSSILVRCNRDGSASMELGNLLAKEECTITLRYAQVLQIQQGGIRCMLPTTMAPRYGDAVLEGGFELHTAPLHSALVEYPFTVELEIDGELAQAAISCPSHQANMRLKHGKMLIALGTNVWLDRDFIVLLQDLPSSSQATWSPDALEPSQSVVVANLCALPDTEEKASFARGVRAQLLIDCSGSMCGSSMCSAQNAVRSIIDMLDDRDAFSISRFGSQVEHCHSRLVTASTAQKQHAQNWAQRLQADMGGTEMEGAILSTLNLADAGADLLLVTDGEIHSIDSLIRSIKLRAHRIFVVGIGSSPAEGHLRRLAAASGGACEFVALGEAVEPAILRMFRRLRSPRVTRLRLQLPQGLATSSQENLPSTCFAADQISTYLRFDGAWPEGQSLALWGFLDGAAEETLLAQCQPVQVNDPLNTAARLYAHAACMHLQGDVQPDTLKELQALAVRYQIITDETHFVLVHERAEQDKPEDMPVLLRTPNMLPENMTSSRRSARSSSGALSLSCAATSIPSDTMCSIGIPSVWRTSRTLSALRMDSGDLGDLELPAFLRRSAPAPAARTHASQDERQEPTLEELDCTPADFVNAVSAQRLQRRPHSYAQLRALNVPETIVDWLEKLGRGTLHEAQIVKQAVELLLQLARKHWQCDQELRAYAQHTHPQLQELLKATAQTWPDLVLV